MIYDIKKMLSYLGNNNCVFDVDRQNKCGYSNGKIVATYHPYSILTDAGIKTSYDEEVDIGILAKFHDALKEKCKDKILNELFDKMMATIPSI